MGNWFSGPEEPRRQGVQGFIDGATGNQTSYGTGSGAARVSGAAAGAAGASIFDSVDIGVMFSGWTGGSRSKKQRKQKKRKQTRRRRN